MIARRAFSLVEFLVAVGVIAILLAITLPVLTHIQAAARKTMGLANLRESASLIGYYREDNGDTYPRVQPGVGYPLGINGPVLTPSSIWSTEYLWHSVIRDNAPLMECWRLWVSPGRRVEPPIDTGFRSSVSMSQAFLANGALWTEQSQSRPPEELNALLHHVRGSQVAFPANKVLLYDFDAAFDRRQPPRGEDGMPRCPTTMAFADGHADIKLIADALTPTRNPLLAILNPIAAERPIHNTTDGVQGRDY